MRYRKKPVEVEAVRYLGGLLFPIENWVQDALANGELFFAEFDDLYVKTLEGCFLVQNGDYIIRGVKGELYPCKPDIFEHTYELVEDQTE